MSTEKIFGGWDTMPERCDDQPARLWHMLAAQNVGSPNFKPHNGLSQRRAEITMLWQLFMRQRPQLIMEVGVAQGGTLAGWCQLAPDDAEIICVDQNLDDCRPRAGEPVHPHISDQACATTRGGGGIYHLRRAPTQKMMAVNGWTTHEATKDAVLKALAGRKVEFLWHDASHSSELFAQDFKFFWPLVADGGVFATHDIQASKVPECNKSVEWERIRREEDYSACFELLGSRNDDSMGIGILIK